MTVITEIARRHKRIAWGKDVCICEESWPCDASILAAMLTPERLAEALVESRLFSNGLPASWDQSPALHDQGRAWATVILAALDRSG